MVAFREGSRQDSKQVNEREMTVAMPKNIYYPKYLSFVKDSIQHVSKLGIENKRLVRNSESNIKIISKYYSRMRD